MSAYLIHIVSFSFINKTNMNLFVILSMSSSSLIGCSVSPNCSLSTLTVFCRFTSGMHYVTYIDTFRYTKVSIQKKNTGLFGNFSQTSDPPPPLLGTPRSK